MIIQHVKCERCGELFLDTEWAHETDEVFGEIEICPKCSSKGQFSMVCQAADCREPWVRGHRDLDGVLRGYCKTHLP